LWISALVSGKLFDSCSAVLFWEDYLVFIVEEWMNSRAGLYVVVKKEALLLLNMVWQVRGLCSQANLKFFDCNEYDVVVGI
jgi:hypothetical protein